MEWFSVNRNNTVYNICIHVDTNNTIDIFVRDGYDNLYHGRDVRNGFNSADMAIMLFICKQKLMKLNKIHTMLGTDIVLSFRNNIGIVVIGDLHQHNYYRMEILLVKKENYKSRLYGTDDDLLASLSLVNMKHLTSY